MAKRKDPPGAALVALAIVVSVIVGGLHWAGVIDLPSGAGPLPAKSDNDRPAAAFDEARAADDYPGDRASKPAIAKWMGRWVAKAGLPPELPVMAALVESSLYNMPDGDRDSVGYFQMRTGIWLGQYPGYPSRPERQLKWFIAKALQVKRQREARGWTSFARDPSQWGGWAADIELPDERYRGRYQTRLSEARRLLR